MPKIVQQVMLTLDEVYGALSAVPIVDLDGERCVDGAELLRAVQRLTGAGEPRRDQPARDPETVVPFRADLAPGPGTLGEPPPIPPEIAADADPMQVETIDHAAAILRARPPGKCVGCAQPRDECPCDVYVDSVVRDPMEYARDLLQKGSQAPPWWPVGGLGIQSAVSQFDVATMGLHTGNPANPAGGRFPAHDGNPIQ